MSIGRGMGTACIVMALLLVLAACKLAQVVLEPAAFAIFIVVIVSPIKKALEPRVGNGAALIMTLAGTTFAVLALVSLIVWEAREIVDWISKNIDRIQDSLIASTAWLERHDIFVFTLLSDQFNPATILRILQAAAAKVNALLAFSLIVMLYVVLGLKEADVIHRSVAALENKDTSSRLLAAGEGIGRRFQTYIVVRTGASICTGLSVWVLARLIGLEMAAAWGMLAFSLNYLPYIGSFVVTALLPLFALVQFGSMETAGVVLLGVLFIQAIIGSYLEPVFSGEALSISPPLVLFSIVLWTFLWGGLGAFLGVPISIALITVLGEFPSTRSISGILSGGRIEGRNV